MKRRTHAFSLIELLVVIAVIGILTAFTVMSVGSVGQARKLTTAGNLTVDIINHARQSARARNTLTLVAVIRSGSEDGRAITALAFAATNGTNGTWQPIEKWRVLPEGTRVDVTASTNFFSATPASALPITRSGQTVTCATAVFLPDGRPLNPTAQPQVLFVASANPAAGSNNFYKIIVNQATGIPVIRRP